jgi:hypothetical protein
MKEEFGDSKGVINQNPYIEKQATQWPKEKSTKGQATIYKTHT